ncbi:MULTISPECIES: hypothetical protein [Parafrankia]|uniref:Integral membrane protein n=1 Tax=Parafrankia soli TaxID=2599596 RepID=A0A1S1RNE6_9ACTN|nr:MULTISPECIES: hypothetical protein [Parafrankia]OHV46925.1 hypothetical protein BBK14_01335 [Parafrankia soli]TCJ40300.1 hypothetical protein E0504_05380 [Parafrankia sp. BMG5.11]SQD98419.1 conserved membrane hypothetical protein [Parafrankia sp. Ea1.12]
MGTNRGPVGASGPAPAPSARVVPRPLLAAGVLLGVETAVLAGLGALLVVRGFGSDIEDVGRAETGGVLALVGAACLGLVTWGVLRGRSGFRSPALVTQVLCLPVAWGLLQGGLYGYGVPLVVVPLAIIVSLGFGGGYARPAEDGDA